MIIDPPSPFADKSEWRAFLNEMEKLLVLNPNSDVVQMHIDAAKDILNG